MNDWARRNGIGLVAAGILTGVLLWLHATGTTFRRPKTDEPGPGQSLAQDPAPAPAPYGPKPIPGDRPIQIKPEIVNPKDPNWNWTPPPKVEPKADAPAPRPKDTWRDQFEKERER